MTKRTTPLIVVHSLDEIPSFASEAEESEYWGKHAFSEELWEQLPAIPERELPPPRPRTRSIAVRFDDSTLGRIKALAARRRKGYQTLLKEFVVERLYEEEKREGLVDS